MRNRVLICLIVTLALLASCVAVLAACGGPCSAKNDATSTRPAHAKAKVLCLIGGPFHNWDGLAAYAQKMLDDTKLFDTNVTENRDELVAPNIDKYDLVIIYTTGFDITPEQEKGLVAFVENGKGLVGIHSATDSFKNSDAYWKLVCGRFTGHGHKDFHVNITGKSHPVVKGMSGFDINDETYVHKFSPESKPIFLTRRDDDGEPSAWVQYYGKGRVFVTGLGHDKEAWDAPGFQQLVIRGMLWADKQLNP